MKGFFFGMLAMVLSFLRHGLRTSVCFWRTGERGSRSAGGTRAEKRGAFFTVGERGRCWKARFSTATPTCILQCKRAPGAAPYAVSAWKAL